MLLDLYEWFLLINDGIDLVLSNLASGTYPVPFSFLIVIVLFGLISVLAWRSTDIPDLPPAPRPPYVIQITTGPATAGGNRQTISDVRLLSGGFFDGHEILSRYRIISRNQSSATATGTDRNSQQQPGGVGTTGGTAPAGDATTRNVEVRGPFRETVIPNANIIRRLPAPVRWFPLGLFRRPHILTRQVPGIIPSGIRTQLTSSPNVVVYHRVNVYHHHIHSHPSNSSVPQNQTIGNGNSNSDSNSLQAEDQNQVESNSVQSSSTSTSLSSVPQQERSSSLASSPIQILAPTGLVSPEQIAASSSFETSPNPEVPCPSPDGPQQASVSVGNSLHHNQIYNAFSSSAAAHSDSIVDSNPTVAVAVQFGGEEPSEESLQNLSADNSSPVPSTSPEQDKDKMATTTEETSNSGSGNQAGEHVNKHPPNNSQQQQRSSAAAGGPPTGAAGDGNDIHFTIKFLNDTQMDVVSQLNEKIIDFKRRHFATEMSENKTVRLIFNGRVLDNDNASLAECGIFDQCVVHCLIVNRQQHQPNQQGDQSTRNSNNVSGGGGQQQDGLQGNMRRVVGLPEPGMFFIAFIGIFLIFLWFVCLHFGQHLFTQSAVVSLTVLTAIFLIGIVACYLPIPAN